MCLQDLANKGPSRQSYNFSSSHVWMWELDYKESWVSKNCCFWTMVLEKTLESPLDSKEIQPVHPKGNSPKGNLFPIFIGRTDAEAEAPVLWPPDVKSWLIGKDSDAGKDWGQEEKGVIEDEMVGWHHWLNGHESEQTLRDSERQGSLARWCSWCHKESDTTWWMNNKAFLVSYIMELHGLDKELGWKQISLHWEERVCQKKKKKWCW